MKPYQKKTLTVSLYATAAIVAITIIVTLSMLLHPQLPEQISYKQANLKHAIAAVSISDLRVGVEKKEDGLIVLLYENGTSQAIPTSVMWTTGILWNNDGLYFSDPNFDYYINSHNTGHHAIKHHKMPPSQVGIFENHQHEVINVISHGFNNTGKNHIEFNNFTRGKAHKAQIVESRIYNVASACASGTYFIALDDASNFAMRKLEDKVSTKHVLTNTLTQERDFSRVLDDTVPCVDNTIIAIGQIDNNDESKKPPYDKTITYGIYRWNTQSGKSNFLPFTMDNKQIHYHYGEKPDFQLISYGNKCMLNDHELLAIDQSTGILYLINTITGQLQIKLKLTPSKSPSVLQSKYWLRVTKNTIAVMDINSYGKRNTPATLYLLDKQTFNIKRKLQFDHVTSTLLMGKIKGHHFSSFAINPRI